MENIVPIVISVIIVIAFSIIFSLDDNYLNGNEVKEGKLIYSMPFNGILLILVMCIGMMAFLDNFRKKKSCRKKRH